MMEIDYSTIDADSIKATPFPKDEQSTEPEGMNEGPMIVELPNRKQRRSRRPNVRVVDGTKGTREDNETRKKKNRKRGKVAKAARKRNR